MKRISIITTNIWQKVDVQNFSESCVIRPNWDVKISHVKNPWIYDEVNLLDWQSISLWKAHLIDLRIKWEDTAFIEVFYNVKEIANLNNVSGLFVRNTETNTIKPIIDNDNLNIWDWVFTWKLVDWIELETSTPPTLDTEITNKKYIDDKMWEAIAFTFALSM